MPVSTPEKVFAGACIELSFKRSQGLVSIFLPQRNAVNANNSNTNGNK